MLINATAIVAHKNLQMACLIFDFHLNTSRSGMPESIGQRFPPDKIQVITDSGTQSPGSALDNNAKTTVGWHPEILLNPQKCFLQILGGRFRGAQSSKRVPAIVDNPGHEFENPAHKRLGRRIFLKIISGDMKLHRGAEYSLQQRIVQLLRNPRSLGKPFVETNIHLLCELADSQTKKCQHRGRNSQQYGQPKPPRLPKHRLDLELQRGLRAIPQSVAVTGSNVEEVRSRIKVRINRLARRGRLAPPLIKAIESVHEPDSRGDRKADPRVASRNPLMGVRDMR